MKKKLLYIKHTFQNKTKSNDFLQNLLREKYDVEVFDFDPYTDNALTHFESLKNKEYDVLLLFQIMPDIDLLKKFINFKQGVFFPMYDAAVNEPDIKWFSYRDFNIINFSKTLHEKLLSFGLSSFYIQYFQPPQKEFEEINLGDEKSIFFWQRLTSLNFNFISNLFKNMGIKHLHIHKSPDPKQKFVEPKNVKFDITYSTWYDKKEDMLKDIEKSAIYIAPRYFEGIGQSFLEAMALGRCVIAPDRGTMNEYIEHGKTGFLYTPHKSKIKPLKNINIREIQKNAYEYIKQGFEKWEKDKYQIFDWIEKTPEINEDLINKTKKNLKIITKHYLFGFIPMVFVEEKVFDKTKSYKLFNFIEVFKIRRFEFKTKYSLLGVPVWKWVK